MSRRGSYIAHLRLSHEEHGSWDCEVVVTPGRRPSTVPDYHGWDPGDPGEYEVRGTVRWYDRTSWEDGDPLPDLDLTPEQCPPAFWRAVEAAWERGAMDAEQHREAVDE